MTLNAVRRRLAEANAPAILQSLFSEELGETQITAMDGCIARVFVDVFDGKRTAVAEYHNAGTLCRFEATDTEIIFSSFTCDLNANGEPLSTTRMSIDDLINGTVEDLVGEFMERVQ